jgi:flagellar hook-associated protein 1
MSVNQALAAALSGVNVTQQGISVIAGNIANANTPGYIDETLNQVELGTSGTSGTSVSPGEINRNLNSLLQNQLWTETSGDSYADETARRGRRPRSMRSSIISAPRCNLFPRVRARTPVKRL